MPLQCKNSLAVKYRSVIERSYDRLVEYFDFEPGDISAIVLPLEEFDRLYESERGHKPLPFIVGSALDNGRILVLDREDFAKKQSHSIGEFESVILHELSHIFVRRITWPRHASIWIQEGICEYLSFGSAGFSGKDFVPFDELESEQGWDAHNPYPQVGAFFEYLARTYGDKKIVSFIKGLKEGSGSEKEVFKRTFNHSLRDLEKVFVESYS